MAKVMIVDDAAFMRMMLRNTLEEGGHIVIGEAANGREAVERFTELHPDLITMDITMPEMDGIEAVRAIMGRHPQARILMCSAMGQQQMVLDAIQAGAKGFIVKPFNKQKVLEEVQRVCV
ncbi:response regulator [Alicyclobacillus mengziensis]|uniref:Response regulator n=1 Tax=Alicyclobacillus mengziensis TaxID=2931921 RepID=A0A9X7VXV5_9BACL|nr:response regulator [Alicyclobacillus mengziensis]QSO47031.1 response regulator [Alicyclobacillus mengziensis]